MLRAATTQVRCFTATVLPCASGLRRDHATYSWPSNTCAPSTWNNTGTGQRWVCLLYTSDAADDM
eukprot:157370-Alexandrium_andersonii.AAC.1